MSDKCRHRVIQNGRFLRTCIGQWINLDHYYKFHVYKQDNSDFFIYAIGTKEKMEVFIATFEGRDEAQQFLDDLMESLK